MKILVQVGNLPSSIVDHLMRPIAQAQNVEQVLVVCRHPGFKIRKVQYYCAPSFISQFRLVSIIYEFFTLFYLSIFKRIDCIVGCLLFPHGLMSFITAKLTRRPVIISLISGSFELGTKRSLPKIDFTNSPPWHGKVYPRVLKYCNAIITTGSITKGFLIRQGIEENKIYSIISPPNKSRFYPMKLPIIYDVISVARLVGLKHIEVLLKAVSIVKRKYGNIKVCVVGDGPRRGELEKLANDLVINDNVDFVGFQQDVAYYYNSSKIFVLTSEREGFPNVFLEAIMCGIPSIVSNCGDITDIAEDGFNCIVIPYYSDYAGFASAIIHLLEDEDFYHRLAQNTLETARSHSIEKITQTWQAILQKTVKGAKLSDVEQKSHNCL